MQQVKTSRPVQQRGLQRGNGLLRSQARAVLTLSSHMLPEAIAPAPSIQVMTTQHQMAQPAEKRMGPRVQRILVCALQQRLTRRLVFPTRDAHQQKRQHMLAWAHIHQSQLSRQNHIRKRVAQCPPRQGMAFWIWVNLTGSWTRDLKRNWQGWLHTASHPPLIIYLQVRRRTSANAHIYICVFHV